ncbi:MAG: hypothetical protein HZC24_10135 [Rhodocyclales bacterium]|nr:hypothetical protein [Rhodocyclales bacterium]
MTTNAGTPIPSATRAVSLALMLWFSIGLFFLLVSWWFGGDRYYDGIFGHYTLAVMTGGLAVGCVLHLVAQRSGDQT